MDGIGKWFSSGDNLQGLGSLIGAGASVYGAIQQSKQAKKLYSLQKNDYDWRRKKQKQSEDAFNAGFGGGLVDL